MTVPMQFCRLYFNSQPRKGADSIMYQNSAAHIHFNSQPRKGADVHDFVVAILIVISTHSPARGLTQIFQTRIRRKINFNSQPRKGADSGPSAAPSLILKFQLTAPQGG